MKLIRAENAKTLLRIAIFLIGSGFVLSLFGFIGKNYATAFLGGSFSLLSFLCLLCIDKGNIFIAKILWAIVTPVLIFLSPVFFPVSQPIVLVTYGYLYMRGMLFTSYSFHEKSEQKVKWLSIALFFTGILFYDKAIINYNFSGSTSLTFITNNYTYFKVVQIIHFISVVCVVLIFHANKASIEQKLSDQAIKMQHFNNDLISISKSKMLHSGNLIDSLKEILQYTSKALDVSRISVWEYIEQSDSIQLILGYDIQHAEFTYSGSLKNELYPTYFKYLLTEKIIAAKDAVNDPKTAEFTESYLKPFGIKSMMDCPFFIDGEFKGIICCEEQREYRDWDQIDQLFSVGVSKLISIAYYCAMRKEQYALLLEANHEQERQNNLLELINNKITDVNTGLVSELIGKEQGIYEMQNFIEDISHRNAHHVRGPLCRIIGLVRLYKVDGNADNRKLYIEYMEQSAQEMDAILKEVSQMLNKSWEY